MHIKKIKANNFKTYLKLDLDISVELEKPLILIGGANGGGKTTLFEAIYGALYGLKLATEQQFNEFLNAGIKSSDLSRKIELEIHFTGKVLNEEQQYVLTRSYMLNSVKKPVESVKLNMNGNIFTYGTATPPKERQKAEAEVNKIIKANLPQELSRYFLFDAMESGNLIKEDQLNRVIKENIENVMGFNKYLQLARVSENLLEYHTANRLALEKERQEYLSFIDSKKQIEGKINLKNRELEDALEYSIAQKELYEKLKAGVDEENTINSKINQLNIQIDNTVKKQKQYKEDAEELLKNFEFHIALPKLAEALKSEISLILQKEEELNKQTNYNIKQEAIELITNEIINYLKSERLLNDKEPDIKKIVEYIHKKANPENNHEDILLYEDKEIEALRGIIKNKYTNPFLSLEQQQHDLNLSVSQIPKFKQQIEDLKKQISGKDYTLMKGYEDNEVAIKQLEKEISESKIELKKIEKKISEIDIPTPTEPDPKFELLKKLKPFFLNVSNHLLLSKKRQIEVRMLQDLNRNLIPYKDVISKVELSEDLKNLSFKIYHKSGNEIYLNQLNTASKQMIVQCLLKSLHEFGDYDPPVMIDTVMGVLDEQSRETVLENYFPQLSHQTILLSSNSEIRKEKDLEKIETFISKSYTLIRDKENQKTDIEIGYFGALLK